VADGLVVAGWSPPEGQDNGQGGFALIDASTGAIVRTTEIISAADQAKGYAGGGLWSTPAYDPSTHYLYWGAGNPDSKTMEDPHTNAILKIDLDRSSATFGQVVASYKGNVDQYTQALQALSQTPACSASDNGVLAWPLDDPVCGQLDLDFGASAQLFRSDGAEVVGDLQKSGVYHVANATTMKPAWSQIIGLSCAACNAASTAVEGGSVFGVGVPGGVMYGLAGNTGAVQWRQPIADGLHYGSTSAANGIVYTIDGNGFLDAFAAKGGQSLLRQSTALDTMQPPSGGAASNGVAIAEHTVLVAVSSGGGAASGAAGSGMPASGGAFLIAYRP